MHSSLWMSAFRHFTGRHFYNPANIYPSNHGTWNFMFRRAINQPTY
ncbi:hypothetical protein ABIB24_004727 [Pseudomonas sp. UYEF17]